ncbi:hypothetical protein RM652_12395 [Mammaliicoccus sciuri]|uniref:hypothetical protein n=1 Tax=Mammaliicoccus sciuri TaxID=1296 RepID=UPI002887732A|nr:hypothetical protein [Mammaliicoccus sciuri]MDT0703922.1 hypothetical protein [Mammaliicoccus sciuri]
MGLFSHIDKLLSRLTEDETEKWLRFHDELDERYSNHRKKWDWYWNAQDVNEKRKYATGGLRERPNEIDPRPFLKKESNNHGGITCEEGGKLAEIISDKLFYMSEEDKTKSKVAKTFYVLEIKNKYVDYVNEIYVDEILVQEDIKTSTSLSRCEKFETFDNAVEYAVKHKITANVRKITVQIED